MKHIRMFTISVFDHWLSAEEARDSNIITYSCATKNDALDEYLEGEKRFIKLYTSVAEKAYCYTSNNSEERELLSTKSAKFIRYLTNGLREHGLHHFRYVENDVVVKGGFDRTDSIIMDAEDKVTVASVHKSILSHGLFVLDNELISEQEYVKLFE